MKIFKSVFHYQLEQATRDGWAIEQTLPSSRYEKVQCATPITVMARDGGYNNSGYVDTNREELVQVNEPIFIMWKDGDGISREEALIKQLSEANDRIKQLDERHKLDERDQRDLTKKVEGLEETRTELQTKLGIEQTARRSMENHLVKIRTAIGTVRYDEILAS